MDSDPKPATGSDPDFDPQLLDAVSRAARHVGSGEGSGAAGGLRFDSAPGNRRRLWILSVTLLVAVVGATVLSLTNSGELTPRQQEEDLRWAVAQVVNRVEAIRAQTGQLPSAESLHGLVSDLVVYEPGDEFYFVVGRRGEVQVLYDGSVPLSEWLGQSGAPPSP